MISAEKKDFIIEGYDFGFSYEYLAAENDVSISTVAKIRERAKKAGKIAKTSVTERFSYGIEAYLLGNGEIKDRIRAGLLLPTSKKAIECVSVDDILAPLDGYGKLLDAVFGFTQNFRFNVAEEELENILEETSPDNYNSQKLAELVKTRLVARIRNGEYIPLFSDSEQREIDKILEALLPDREREIIYLKFLDDNPKTLAEIGFIQHDISKQVIGEIEQRALERLKHSKLLREYLTEKERRKSLELKIEELEEMPEVYEKLIRMREKLDMSIDRVEMSVRSHNCLNVAGISTFKDLVEKTENEMLKCKNFGRKSLSELNGILEKKEMGLKFGMDVSPYY